MPLPYLFYYKNNLTYKSIFKSDQYGECIRRGRSNYNAKTFNLAAFERYNTKLARLEGEEQSALATIEQARVSLVTTSTRVEAKLAASYNVLSLASAKLSRLYK